MSIPEEFDLLLYDALTGKNLARADLSSPINIIEFGPDDRLLATVEENRALRVWSAPRLNERNVYRAPTSMAEVRPTADHVAAAGESGVRVWTTNPVPGVVSLGRSGKGHEPVIDPSGDRVAYIDTAGRPHLDSLRSGRTTQLKQEHDEKVLDIAFGPEGEILATAGQDGTLRLWNANTGTQRSVLRHNAPIRRVAFAADRHRVVTFVRENRPASQRETKGGTVTIWDLDSGHTVAEIGRVSDIGSFPMRVTPDRSRILVARKPRRSQTEQGADPKHPDSIIVEIRSAETGDRTGQFGEDMRLEGLHEAVSPDSRYALALQDTSVALLNLEKGHVEGTMVLEGNLEGVAFGAESERIALTEKNTEPGAVPPAHIFDLQTQERVRTLKYPPSRSGRKFREMEFLQFAPDGNDLVTVVRTVNKGAYPVVWHFPTDRSTPVDTTFLPSHEGRARPARFGSDGKYLLTISGTESRLFGADRETDATFMEEVTDQKHPGPVGWAQFTPNADHVVTRARDGQLRVWPVYDSPQALIDTARAAATRHLTDAQREEFNLVNE